jgi:transcriptional regulator with XRE-family HTH domain
MGCVTFEDRLPTMSTAPKKLPAKSAASPTASSTQAPAPLPAANFPARLIQTRRQASMTQQALADAAGVHVNQIKRYEAGAAQPTLEALVGLARALHVSLDQLVFDEGERGPSDDLRLQFEAVSHMSDDDRRIIKALLDGMIVKHQTKQMVGNLSS